MALNLLTEDPRQPSGAHWCWTRIVPEMANRLLPGEELHLMLSPSARHYFPDYGDAVRCITFPWSNEHRILRTASEHLVTPFRLPLPSYRPAEYRHRPSGEPHAFTWSST